MKKDKQLNKMLDLIPFKGFKPEPVKELPNIKEGDCVHHRRFGKGFIVSVNGDKCEVLFKSVTKELLSRFANFKHD